MRIRKPAPVERQTAAADAVSETRPEAFELGDPLVYPCGPPARETGPITAGRGAIGWKLFELRADLLQRQPDSLGEDDERDPT
jgi:hypothetical protein